MFFGGFMQYLIISIINLIAGFVQGISGFGSSIVVMMVLPTYYTVLQAAGISNAINIFLNGMMAYRYKDYISMKKVLSPALLFLISSTLITYVAMDINEELIKKIFGVFLVILSIYFMFFSKNTKKELSPIASYLCIIVAGICNGMFGIGGPLMVIYLLSQIDDMKEYLGTMQAFFCLINICVTSFRFASGILTFDHMGAILIGIPSVAIGLFLANKIVDKVDGDFIKKAIYIVLGLSGLLNII